MLEAGLYAAAAAFLSSKRHTPQPDRSVLVGQMIRSHDIDMRDIALAGVEDDLVQCSRTCLSCSNRAQCRERLNGVDRPVYRDICPNARFIDGLKTLRELKGA